MLVSSQETKATKPLINIDSHLGGLISDVKRVIISKSEVVAAAVGGEPGASPRRHKRTSKDDVT